MSLLQEGLLYKHIYSCLSLAGIIVSVYGFCLEVIKEYDPSYTPLCDVNQQVSCTKAMMSSWGRGFGIVSTLFDEDSVLNQRNPVYGVAFYTLLLIVPIIKEELIATVGFVLVCASIFVTVYLMFILAFRIKTLCLVCVTIYIINFALFITVLFYRSVDKRLSAKKRL
ncbi:vitamin K epoxide reductase family protein [Trichuris suis]|nr:vitamin K epoxide reductase family protein [Trichuris suis]